MTDDRDPKMERFDSELRAWAGRPPARTPAAAAREIAAQIEGRPTPAPRFHPGWAWTAAGLAAAVGIVGLLRVGDAPPTGLAPTAPSRASGPAPPHFGGGALDEGQVLIWLDPETPLYMNFAPPTQGPHAGGDS
jgi:hypothetical protein